ncbi:hypothetical protein YPPY34_0190 [Yersinia pestis PY-34]|nr:hypothetical protein YPPY19_0214 [Yersinia pestis PY-19]EIR83356.1 hypothetical protein YPPY34_0190 [Yersinia pestis PY-34]EIR97720.1 hypothetical protein YPPY42_0185 [Yersinia pestis PY-42]EIS84566.1 hypothetical protein YPPY72_0106 [Yersinia pestis PY-72]
MRIDRSVKHPHRSSAVQADRALVLQLRTACSLLRILGY